MDRQLEMLKEIDIQKDIVSTPKEVALSIVQWLQPLGICLDPCKGDGSFYELLPNADWCELKEGKDFYEYQHKVDWIIGNPPYSKFEKWLEHSFELVHDVAYILPTNKVFQRQLIMRMINNWGGIKGLMVYGSGSIVGFPFGFSVGTFHFSKDYKGKTDLILATK